VTVRHFFSIVELKTKVISLSTFLLALLYALDAGGVPPARTALLFVAVLAVDMGTTAFNSFFDYVRNVDNRLYTREPDKVLVYEGVAPGHALIVSMSLYLVAAISGVVLALTVGWWILLAGALSMAVGFLYTGGPLPISRTPVGELFAGGFLGSVLFLIVIRALGAEVTPQAVLASVPSTLMIASVLTVNNTCDRQGDIAAGRKTLSILVGPRLSEVLIYLLGAGAFGIPLVQTVSAGAAGGGAVGAVVALAAGGAAAAAAYSTMHRRGYSHATKRPNMQSILLIVIIFTAAYGTALALV
jgi:1,4-dihydroxy-2-naphthoate octaprenyltransferase